MADPVAHLGVDEGVVRPKRRLGMRLAEMLADLATLMERAIVPQAREASVPCAP
jgi:hypothetical protein